MWDEKNRVLLLKRKSLLFSTLISGRLLLWLLDTKGGESSIDYSTVVPIYFVRDFL